MPRHRPAVVPLTKRAGGVHAARARGFTLLELCMVLFILALLAGAAMPAMDSAFTEQELRTDAHQFSLMVKTGMIKSGEQNRPYVLDLAGKDILLQPVGMEEKAPAAPSFLPAHSDPDAAPTLENVTMDLKLTNGFLLPDAKKKDTWDPVSSERWTFQPSNLCPLPRVRLTRGRAWIEMSFNALTGNVEDEATFIP
jgi:prepilin-type N-terminal cleavage/methylation domain-containing protein